MDYNTFHQPKPDQQYPFGLHPYQPAPPPQRHVGAIVAAFAAVICLMLISGGVGVYIGRYLVPSNSGIATQSTGPSYTGGLGNLPTASSNPGVSIGNAASIAAAVDPGLVYIDTNLTYQQEAAAGTGMVLTSSGLVLTNNHVIDGETSITATDVGNGKTYQAKILGYDKTQDVALIQLENASGLATVTIGNSSKATVGDSIVGIGNAGGVGKSGVEPSYAAGQITALGQSITASDQGSNYNEENLVNMIEINANIQPGDSGGPLVASNGDVIGMDTAGAQSNSGGFGAFPSSGGATTQAYAIPINTALSIAKSIDASKSSSTIHIGGTAFLGVEVEAPTTVGQSGALVVSSLSGTPAASSSLTQGDIITSFDGQTVTSVNELGVIVLTLKPGQSVPLIYETPSGTSVTITLQLTSGPPQ